MSILPPRESRPRPVLIGRSALALTILASVVAATYFLVARNRPGADVGSRVASQVGLKEKAGGATVAVEKPALSESEAKYLQDVEHLGGFVLGDLAFPKVVRALRDRDADRLKGFLADDFTATLFAAAGGQVVAKAEARFVSWKEGRDPTATRDRDGFVADLLAVRDSFAELSGCEMKIMLMGPEEMGNLTGPWAGSFKLRFAGRDREGRVAERVTKFRCRVAPITDETPDRPGWLLSCVAYAAGESRNSDFLMRDMTAETGIDARALWDNWEHLGDPKLPFLTGGIYLVDYDQDGRIDLLITDLNGIFLYRGRPGGRFEDVTEQVGLPRKPSGPAAGRLGAAFADFDNDGYEDLIIGTSVFRNREGREFQPLTLADTSLYFYPGTDKFSVVDYDRDGLLDLYVVGVPVKAASDTDGRSWFGDDGTKVNQLLRNRGGWQFEDVTESAGARGRGGATFAAVWFDADDDGWMDLMTSREFGQNDYLLNNRDGTFRPGELPEGFGGFSMGITVSDIDNDGLPDPWVANMYSKAGERVMANLKPGLYPPELDAQMRDFVTGNELYHNLGGGRFERNGRSAGINDVGWAYGTGYADLNNDGLEDLYSPVGFQSITRDKPDG